MLEAKMKSKIFKPRIIDSQQLSTSTASTLRKDQIIVGGSISQIISHDYLKNALEDRINRNALESVALKISHPKDIMTKAEKLRSKSVARVLKKYEYEQQIEDMKIKKASANDVSFSEIERNHFKFKKELSLPPITGTPGTSKHGGMSHIKGGKTELSVIASPPSNTTPVSPTRAPQALNAQNNTHNQVLDEIYNLRLKVYEKAQVERPPIKISVNKKEKDDILQKYFSAKRQLNSVTQGK